MHSYIVKLYNSSNWRLYYVIKPMLNKTILLMSICLIALYYDYYFMHLQVSMENKVVSRECISANFCL